MDHLLALGMPGGWEWIAVAVIALLIFGKRLPDVARSIGRGIVEFKRGLQDVDEQVNQPPPPDEKKNSPPSS